MNWLKKGPELKLSGLKPSELKVPPFLSDLYWDLRDRRLLPLVALAIVAIVAVPFLLGGGSRSSQSAPLTLGVSAPAGGPAGASGSSLTVEEAKPGLREPSKRLAHLHAKDPFRQQYTGPVLNPGAEPISQPSTTTTTTTSESSTVSGSTSGGAQSGNTEKSVPVKPPSTSGGGEPGKLTFYTFAVDVKVSLVPGGEASGSSAASSSSGSGSTSSQPTVRHGVKPATPLPGKKAPVVTYMGSIDKAKVALFMVSPEVTSVFGDAKCLSGTSSCQLLGVEAGVPEAFVYGFNHNRLKIEVLKIKPVVTGHS